MDVALKQRLVGALVLVALGVIFIPMVLDGPAGERIERPIAIPDPPDRRFETRLLPVNQTSPEPQTGQEQAPATVLVTSPVTATPVESAPASSVSAQTRPPAATPPADVAADGPFVLQVGSFGNAANAARLVQNLQAAGWAGYQEKVAVGSNVLYRVRVSGWRSKLDAGRAGEQLLQKFPDLDMTVRETGRAVAEQAPLQGWMIQLGSFNSESNALALRDRLRGGGFAAHTQDTGSTAGGRWRVRVGPEMDEAAAAKVRDAIRREFDLRGIIIDHP